MRRLPLPCAAALLALSLLPAPAAAAPAGKKLWTARLPGEATRGCVVDGETVYQGVRRGRGGLVALDRRTGRERWHLWHGKMGVDGAPLVVGDVVVHGSFTGDVVGVDKATGRVRWRFDDDDGGLQGAPVFDGTEVWVGFIGGLAALDPTTGTARLRLPYRAGTHVLGVGQGRVFAHSAPDNAIIALDARTGAELWRVGGPVVDRERGIAAGFQPERVVLDEHALYVPTNVAETWALDPATGKKRWGYEPEGMTFGIESAGDTVLLTSSAGAPGKGWNGLVARVEKATGLVVWRREVPGAMLSIPLLTGDVVVVPTSERGLLGFGKGDGEPRFKVAIGAAYWGACAAPDGTIYVGHEKRRLSAVR